MTICLMIDVDGVVVSGRPKDGLPWVTDIKADLGIKPNDLKIHFFAPFWRDIVVGRRDIEPALTFALTTIKAQVSAQEVMDYWFSNDARIDAGFLAKLDAAREGGAAIYLTTNQEHRRADYLMNTMKLRDHVDGIVYSAAVGSRKPDYAFFAAAEKLTGFESRDHFLIDDTAANVDAAIQSGWSAMHWFPDSVFPDLSAGQLAKGN